MKEDFGNCSYCQGLRVCAWDDDEDDDDDDDG